MSRRRKSTAVATKTQPFKPANLNNIKQPPVVSAASWKGPLPPPSVLHQFDEIIDNGAERIVRMAEQEQAHRHSMDRSCLACEVEDTKRGHWMGFILTLFCLIASVSTAIFGIFHNCPLAFWALPIGLISIPTMTTAQAFFSKKEN